MHSVNFIGRFMDFELRYRVAVIFGKFLRTFGSENCPSLLLVEALPGLYRFGRASSGDRGWVGRPRRYAVHIFKARHAQKVHTLVVKICETHLWALPMPSRLQLFWDPTIHVSVLLVILDRLVPNRYLQHPHS